MDSFVVAISVFCFASILITTTVSQSGCVPNVSQWINNSHPNLSPNRSDIEQLNATELQKLCPIGKTGIECIDEKGEAFDGSKGPAGKFTGYCDLTFGMFCQPVDKTTDTCPDFKVRYSCECDPTTTVGKISGATQSNPTAPTTVFTRKMPSTPTSGHTTGSSNARRSSPSGVNNPGGSGTAGRNPGPFFHLCIILLIMFIYIL